MAKLQWELSDWPESSNITASYHIPPLFFCFQSWSDANSQIYMSSCFLLFMHNPWEFHFYRTKIYSPFETSNTRIRQKGQPRPLQARHPWNYPHTHRHQSAVSWSLAHDSPKNQWKGRIMICLSVQVYLLFPSWRNPLVICELDNQQLLFCEPSQSGDITTLQ